jgi:hypothetical protein
MLRDELPGRKCQIDARRDRVGKLGTRESVVQEHVALSTVQGGRSRDCASARCRRRSASGIVVVVGGIEIQIPAPAPAPGLRRLDLT